jgi:hypothetical protein
VCSDGTDHEFISFPNGTSSSGRISARLDRCVASGFDGVEMDVVDEPYRRPFAVRNALPTLATSCP